MLSPVVLKTRFGSTALGTRPEVDGLGPAPEEPPESRLGLPALQLPTRDSREAEVAPVGCCARVEA